MRVEFKWQSGGQSVLQRDDSAQSIFVDGEQVWPRLPQDEQEEAVPFPIGTRVQCVNSRMDIGGPPEHQFGRVVHLDGSDNIGVEWDAWYDGHNCDGHAARNQGWYVFTVDLVLAPLSQTTTTSYPDCETGCAGCDEPLGTCISEGAVHDDGCLDDMWEADGGGFYHAGCTPVDEAESVTPTFQIGDAVRVTRGAHSRCVGTVRMIDGPNRCGVELPGVSGGINLGGILTNNYGRYFMNDILERR